MKPPHSAISGTGEYDETVLLHALKGLLVVLKSLYFEKTPTEALVIEVRRPLATPSAA